MVVVAANKGTAAAAPEMSSDGKSRLSSSSCVRRFGKEGSIEDKFTLGSGRAGIAGKEGS